VQCLRGAYYAAAPKLQRQILSELGMLAQPPLGLIGLVQPSFLKVCTIVQSTETDSDAATDISCSDCSIDHSDVSMDMDMSCSDRSTFLATAALATRGDQRGSKHGCLLIDEQNGKVMGEGWNHEVVELRGGPQRRRVLHAEVHAVADAIRRHGEQNSFAIFKRCSAWIVELRDDAAYDDAPPCPKCLPLLQSIGVPRVVHSTRTGKLARVQLPREKPDLLSLPMACKPLSYACDELGIRCERLERALVLNDTSNTVK
jgi:tRNA(Arg) A34 adenosine deaminase TadA